MKCSILVAAVIATAVALSALGWFRTPDKTPVVQASSFSSFAVPEHLDASAFAQRLAATGFVAVTDADFRSLLPLKYHAAASAPGQPAPDFTAMPAYRHTANSEWQTRILGYDAGNRRVHYYHAQVLQRDRTGSARDEPDRIEEDLRQ